MRLAPPEALIERAVRRTALSDFGAGSWYEGLSRLVKAMSEHDFDPMINAKLETRLVDVLATRLQIEDWVSCHPEVLCEDIDGPVFIIGLPRTATTALQAFLVNDPQWRYLRDWEAAEPIPPPDIATEATDRRQLARRAGQPGQDRLPAQNLHIQEAGGPVDDLALLRLDFRNQELGWPAWSYTRWWRDCDMSSAYAYHARVLKLLQSRRPPNSWLVKAPWHNFHLEALIRQYPNARLIMCHRDPAQLIPSVVSLLTSVRRSLLSPDPATPVEIGSFVMEHYSVSISRVLDFRRRHGESHFIDVYHREFNADPFGTLREIYRALGVEVSPGADKDMEAWLRRNHKGAHGEHRYSPEEFGMTADGIREVFAAYVTNFNL